MIKIFVIFVTLLIIALIVMSVIVISKPEILQKKNKDKNESGASSGASQSLSGVIGDTKDFVPVTSVDDFYFCVGDDYRAIIECSSVNYNLMSNDERKIVEMLYSSFLNGISFPFDIYIQTREYDKEFMMNDITDRVIKSKKKFPHITEYADNYLNSMDNLLDYIGNTKIKKKFIVVGFNMSELDDVSSLTVKERKEFIIDELTTRINIANSIRTTGIQTRLLNKEEIAQCIYSYYHRDYYLLASDIVNGSFFSVAVNGSETHSPENNRERFDLIITEAQNKIKTELVKDNITPDEAAFFQYADSVLSQIKTTPEKDAFELYQYSRDCFIDGVKKSYGMDEINETEDRIYDYYDNYERE